MRGAQFGWCVAIVALLATTPVTAASTDTSAQAGRLECAAGAYSIATTDRCSALGRDDALVGHSFTPANQSVRGMVVELRWAASTPATAPSLQISLPQFHTADDVVVETNGDWYRNGDIVRGSSPLYLRAWTADPDQAPLYLLRSGNEAQALRFYVRAAGSTTESVANDPTSAGGASGLVLDQPYELAVSFFPSAAPPPQFSHWDPGTWPESSTSQPEPSGQPQEPPPKARPHRDPVAAMQEGTGKNEVAVPAPNAGSPDGALAANTLALVVLVFVLPSILVAWRTRKWLVAVVPGYHRIGKRNALDHHHRQALQEIVQRTPGIRLAAAKAQAGISTGQFQYHARVLERNGWLRIHQSPGSTRLYPAGSFEPRDRGNMEPFARIDSLIRARPGLTMRDVATILRVPQPTVRRRVLELRAQGLVVRRRDGRTVTLHPALP